jgi:2-dehydropantoate 2-reductase
MKIAIFGTGAVGGYFGGRLAQAGEDITFIARGETLAALQQNGLRVDSLKGDFTLHPVQATNNPAEVGRVDVILVAVKSWQVEEAAAAIRPMVGPDTAVIPLQNGVEAPGQLAAVLGESNVLGGLCTIIAAVAAPGHIRHVGAEPYIVFGELDNRPSQRSEQLRQAFSQAGVKVEVAADIQAALWGKFLSVTSWGSVGAVTRAPVGVIRTLPETRVMVEQAMNEIYQVALARGIHLPAAIIAERMAFIDSLPPASTTSMQRDIAGGRLSELEQQTGAVVRLGREVGVATPLYQFIYSSLLPLDLQARGHFSFPT